MNINQILYSIQEFCNSNFQKKELVSKILKMYNSLAEKEKKQVERNMYVIYRELLSNSLTSVNYNDMIHWFEIIEKHERFSTELLDNKSQILLIGIFGYQIWSLENDSNKYNFKIKKTLEMHDNIPPINHNNKELLKKVTSINNYFNHESEIYTKIRFSVPTYIKETNNHEYDIPINDYIVKLNYKTQKLEERPIFDGPNIEREFDTDSILRKTTFTLTFPYYLPLINDSNSNDIFNNEYYILICDIVNKFIEHYRFYTDEYWVRSIYPTMIGPQNIIYHINDIIIREIPYFDPGTFSISTKKVYLEIPNNILENYPLYKKLLYDAEHFLITNKYREAILSLNSSFENYIYTQLCNYIHIASNGDLDIDFYLSPPKYENYFLKDYITYENYQDALNNNEIPYGLSTYQIIKLLYKYDTNAKKVISKRKINKIIENIRKHRNDLIHGNKEITSLSYNNVSKQIESYLTFIETIEKIIN